MNHHENVLWNLKVPNPHSLVCVFVFYDRDWTTSGISATQLLVVLWEEWHSGGNRAIKEAPDLGICQQKAEY